MKILIPTLHYYPVIGGLEVWTKNIAERLSDKAEIFVVTGKVKGEPVKERKNGVNIYRTSPFFLKNLSYSSPIYILTALKFIFLKSLLIIKKEGIDLLHCQGFLSAFLGYLLSKITGIPYIVTVQRLEEKRGFLRQLVYKNAKVCIAASLSIREYFERIGCKNIAVIPNGIDLKKFKIQNSKFKIRKRLGLNNEFVVMTVARLEKVKGIEYLIKSISNLKSQISNLICLIVGEGSERKNLEKLVEKLNIKEKVKFLGQVPNEKIPEYLAAADLFVLPSLREGFGIAILEAQAAKLPVIATNVGGIPDIIEPDRTGILVEPKNPKALSEAISRIYSNLVFSQKLVQRAKENLDKYNWNKIAEKVNYIYSQFATLA
jgi:glycosyltransferase involved in cell wall biosynthesis